MVKTVISCFLLIRSIFCVRTKLQGKSPVFNSLLVANIIVDAEYMNGFVINN